MSGSMEDILQKVIALTNSNPPDNFTDAERIDWLRNYRHQVETLLVSVTQVACRQSLQLDVLIDRAAARIAAINDKR